MQVVEAQGHVQCDLPAQTFPPHRVRVMPQCGVQVTALGGHNQRDTAGGPTTTEAGHDQQPTGQLYVCCTSHPFKVAAMPIMLLSNDV
jgi:hypothetical protein